MSGPEGGYNPFQAEHAQCNNCGKMIRGPHEGTIFEDHNVYAADKERVYTRDEAEAAGLRHNVSGSMCKDCYRDTMDRFHKEKTRREYISESGKTARQGHHLRQLQIEARTAHKRYQRTGDPNDLQRYRELQQRIKDDSA